VFNFDLPIERESYIHRYNAAHNFDINALCCNFIGLVEVGGLVAKE